MGWQIASIVLKNGSRYDRAVIDSGFITRIHGRDDIPFAEDDIAEIIVTNDRTGL